MGKSVFVKTFYERKVVPVWNDLSGVYGDEASFVEGLLILKSVPKKD